MRVERCADAGEFLAATASLRAEEPVVTNVIGSVAALVASGARVYEDCHWWVVGDAAGPVALAMRTVPHPLVLAGAPAAAAALADAVAAADPGLPAVSGPPGAAGAFAGAFSARTGRVAREGREEVLYVADAVESPPVEGCALSATASDEELLQAWHREFFAEVDLPGPGEDAVRGQIEAGALLVWRVDGEPVAMAGHSAAVAVASGTLVRVGPVYTPPPRRSRGYAAAVTATMTARLLAAGHRVMLYADAANATSNGVYRRIGYREVGRVVHVEFAGTAP
jgi:predicted GNAT family acetyltransferase